jgi:serine/threonine protein kinase/tetratricopeptide (TPR) repeat protein
MALPELFGSYVLHYRLAEGSTSEVFLAQTTGDFPRLCAVKRLRPQLAAMPDFSKRFREDAAMLVRLIHGNLVQILEVGATDETPFLAMEQIDGVKAEELLGTVAEAGPIAPEAALHIALEMGEAVSYVARRRGEQVGGGEIPPDHAWPLEVMLSFDGVVKLVDLGSFGALRIGQQSVHSIFQSPGYAVPEVIRKKPLDSRSDVFAVGLLLWELLAGKRLVAGDPEAYVGAVLSGNWKAPMIERKDVPGTVIRTVDQMLRLDPDDRQDSLDRARPELVAALRRLSPSYGSSDLSWLLAERCARTVSHLADLTAAVTRKAKTSHDDSHARSTTTMTYGRAGEIDRPVVEPVQLDIGDPIPGTRYRLVRKLGAGGSAQVYCAQHIDLERQVAIKILDHELARQSGAIAQFRMEARSCSRIGHPNIVDVIDFGELDDGRFFFAMELVEGESLAEVLAKQRRLPVERALPIFRQAAKALAAAHEHHIIHRDMKPENIMLTTSKDGREDLVKVLDFGVMAFASDTAAECVGTPGYMAPEQIEGALPTPQMDIYALGATLYECLSGTLAYPGETLTEYAAQQAAGPAIALRRLPSTKTLHPAIERMVHRALERAADARQPSCADFEADLMLAQREAGLRTAWDDLPPPTGMTDTRRGPLELPSGDGTGEHARVTGQLAAQEHEALPDKRSAAMIWLIALGVVLFGLVGMLAFWPPKGSSSAGTATGKPFRARSPRKNPPPSSVDAAARTIPAALATLLQQAERAAALGHFSQPKGESAYDRILAVEAARPKNDQTPALRKRFATTLEGMGDQLRSRGFGGSARTLYSEALLFTPESAALKAKAAAGGKQPLKGARPEQLAARIAHLVALIDRAVADGRLLKPPRNNALAYLWKLKRLDPSGKGTARVQQLMAKTLRKQASALWRDAKRRAEARQVYARVARLDPDDALAKKRAKDAPPLRPVAIKAGKPGKPGAKKLPAPPDPKLVTDAAKAKVLVIEGDKLLSAGQPKQARAKYKAARGLDPRSRGALLGLARSAFDSGDYVNALIDAKRALSVSPRSIRAQLVLGDASFQLGRKAAAKAAWQKVLSIAPNHNGAKKRLARLGN